MEKVFLLGAFGFIGSNILSYIDSNNLPYEVITFDRVQTHPMGVTFKCISRSISGDFTDKKLLMRIFEEENFDIVIHAISSTVPIGCVDPKFDVETNLIPTLTLLDLMAQHQCKKIVFLSSGGAIYGMSEKEHRETDDVFPISPYGVVKVTVEKFLFLYQHLYGIKPLVLRLSNPYGRFHHSRKQGVVNIALRTARENDTFMVWGDGNSSKDYIYIGDVCKVIFCLIQKNLWGEVFNVGSGITYSVNDILYEIKKNYPSFTWRYEPARTTDVPCSKLCIDKLRQYLDFDFVKLETALPLL